MLLVWMLHSCCMIAGPLPNLYSLNMIVALLAILKTGARYLPLDTDYPDQRLQYVVKDSLCHNIIVSYEKKTRFFSWQKFVCEVRRWR